MGVGDWLMATGEAKKHFAETGRRVAFVDWKGRHHWHEVFENNPKIVKPSEAADVDYDAIRQGGGERPYIERKLARMWVWRDYTPEPGEIFLTDEERRWGEQYASLILIDPYGKAIGHKNKQWGTTNWAIVVRELLRRGIEVANMGDGYRIRPFANARFVKTPSFRHAAAVMENARAVACHEGGLHHLAACFRTPAVVLWSEFISPDQTGYPFQVNLRHARSTCGMRIDCPGCRRALNAITPDEVVEALIKELA